MTIHQEYVKLLRAAYFYSDFVDNYDLHSEDQKSYFKWEEMLEKQLKSGRELCEFIAKNPECYK